MMKRKMKGIVLGAALSLMLTSCGSQSSETISSESTNDNVAVEVKEELPSESPEEVESQIQEDIVTEAEEEIEEEKVYDTLVYEDENVKISFVGIGDRGVNFSTENKTDNTVTIQAKAIAINGVSTNSIIMSDDVAPQSTGTVTAKCDDFLTVSDIQSIGGVLRVISDSFKTYSATFSDIQTDETTSETMLAELEGTPIFEDDNVEISFLYVDSDGAYFSVKNKMDDLVTIQAKSIAVGGISASSIIMSSDISPKSVGIARAKCSDFADITEVEKISGELRIISDNFKTYSATFSETM